jgi:RNA polymerase sigma-70 factor (family 1)
MESNIIKSYLKALNKGSVSAFTALYDMYADKLYSFALSRIKSRELASDIVQETFMKIWSMHKTISTEGSFQSFLFKIANNKIIDHFRNCLNSPEFENYISFAENENFGENTTENTIYFDDFVKALNLCKSKLTERQLEIFELSLEKGLNNQEISISLNIAEHTVRNQLSLALKQVRNEISKYGVIVVLIAGNYLNV